MDSASGLRFTTSSSHESGLNIENECSESEILDAQPTYYVPLIESIQMEHNVDIS
jgi:hypothetical protein